MEHIWILVYFISIAIGLLAAFYSFHLYAAWRYPFLRDIGNYTVVFNLVMVLYLIVKYASANLPGPAAKDHQSSFYTIMVLAALLGEKRESIRQTRNPGLGGTLFLNNPPGTCCLKGIKGCQKNTPSDGLWILRPPSFF